MPLNLIALALKAATGPVPDVGVDFRPNIMGCD